jgi:hypothetical protein
MNVAMGALLGSLVATTLQLPAGWRYPLPNEVSQDWRDSSSHRFLRVSADFNGDGVTDEANLLVKEEGLEVALFARVSAGGANHVIMLDELDGLKGFWSMGIELVAPGEYETACGKGYWECESGEPEVLMLKNPAIDYFASESANSFFAWDVDTQSFQRIWISD